MSEKEEADYYSWLKNTIDELDEKMSILADTLAMSVEWDSEMYRQYRRYKIRRDTYCNCLNQYLLCLNQYLFKEVDNDQTGNE